MKRAIRVECWADFYFFGKLLLNKELVRKEKNKPEVFKSIKERSRGEFSIGIVDSDNEDIALYIKGFEIECRIQYCEEVELIKLKDHHYYILQLSPVEFEKWIIKFIEEDCNKSLSDFGYNNIKEFAEDSKVIPERLMSNEKFIEVIKFVLKNCELSDNHINKMKKILGYLIEKNYNVDINELKNV